MVPGPQTLKYRPGYGTTSKKAVTRRRICKHVRIAFFPHTIDSRTIAMSLHILKSVLVPFSGGKFEN
jgi:hypothetical protein